jgi:hypothetical protein
MNQIPGNISKTDEENNYFKGKREGNLMISGFN